MSYKKIHVVKIYVMYLKIMCVKNLCSGIRKDTRIVGTYVTH